MKTVLVSGAAGGMGQAICQLLHQQGWRVFALDVKPCSLPGVSSLPCDLRSEEAAVRALAWLQMQTGTLDAIVHAAGIYDLDALTEMDNARLERIFDINVLIACRINRLFTPLMQPGGRVVFITSELAPLFPMPFTGVYAVTKKALEGIADSLRTELALRGIRVVTLRPGAVETPLLGDSTAALERFCQNTRCYRVNAERFRRIVDRVEARCVPPAKVAETLLRALTDPHPRRVYNLNRNPLLLMMNLLPASAQHWLLLQILK